MVISTGYMIPGWQEWPKNEGNGPRYRLSEIILLGGNLTEQKEYNLCITEKIESSTKCCHPYTAHSVHEVDK